MNVLAKQILESKEVSNDKGECFPLRGNIVAEEGEFLASLIKQNNFRHTIEIGCAFGISSLFICDALSDVDGAHHTIIDPGQSDSWHGVGVSNLQKAGFDFFNLIEEPSEQSLPSLLGEGKQFDFAFIDGFHTFDHTLLDFFYLNRMIRIGGIIAFDDASHSNVGRAIRYVSKYPCYEFVGGVSFKWRIKRRVHDRVKWIMRWLLKPFPTFLKQQIFDDSILSFNRPPLHSKSLVAFKKISEDNRSHNWYEHF